MNINLVRQTIALGEIVVTAKKPFSLTEEEVKRASFNIDGNEFELLGEPDAEKAMQYLLPDIIRPLRDRLSFEKNDFTLYIDGTWKESAYLDEIDPFSIKRVVVWEELGSSQSPLAHDIFPLGMPLRRGNSVVLIETTENRSTTN